MIVVLQKKINIEYRNSQNLWKAFVICAEYFIIPTYVKVLVAPCVHS